MPSAFFAGYIPHHRRDLQVIAEANVQNDALPDVSVVAAKKASGMGDLVLPGNIQAVTEAPILARAEGYVQAPSTWTSATASPPASFWPKWRRRIWISRFVRRKRPWSRRRRIWHAPTRPWSRAKPTNRIAQVTATRWDNLVKRGAVSKQENDQYQAQYQAQAANVRALERAVDAAKGNIAAMQANVGRLTDMQGYLKVRAPFAGVITLRNVDVGTLVNTGNTMLFRIAQTNLLRTYLNVPQSSASDVHVGQMASLATPELPERKFSGAVTRTANALDPASRTLLVEVQVPNPEGKLLPGMYVEVDLHLPRKDPPLCFRATPCWCGRREHGGRARLRTTGFISNASWSAATSEARSRSSRAERRTAGDRESERFRSGRREGSSGPGGGQRGRTQTLALARALFRSAVL